MTSLPTPPPLWPLLLSLAAPWLSACGGPDLECESVGLVARGSECVDPDGGAASDSGATGESCADGECEQDANAGEGGSDIDTDEDGVADADDNCIDVSNADQADLDEDGRGDACDADRDGDGVDDADDLCPDVPDPEQANVDGDGLGDACDPDDDGDGLDDDSDPCPQGPPDEADSDADGCADSADADDDDDGLLDEDDGCPTDPATPANDADGDGCPLTADACPLGFAVGPDRDGDGCKDDEDPSPDQPGSPSPPRVVHVDASSPGEAATGATWDEAFRSLQDGLDRAEALRGELPDPKPPVHVWVASGTYYADDGASVSRGLRSESFRMREGVEVYGGFRFHSEGGFWRRDELGGSVLEGDLEGNDPDGYELDTFAAYSEENTCHVVWDDTQSGTAVLDGFTIRHGVASRCTPTDGGGIYSTGRGVFRNLLVELNPTAFYAGGALAYGDSIWLNVTFQHNRAFYGAGALSVGSDANVVVYGARFRGNFVRDFGAALKVGTGARLHLINSVIYGNRADESGSALEVSGAAEVLLLHTTIAGNSSGKGIGIRTSEEATWTLRNSIQLETVEGQDLATDPDTEDTPSRVGVTPEALVEVPHTEGVTVEGDLRLRSDVGRNPGIDRGNASHLNCPADLLGLAVPGLGLLCDESGRLRFDIEGHPRTQGPAPDVGAYEVTP